MARQEILMTVVGNTSDLARFWQEWDTTLAGYGLIISEARILHDDPSDFGKANDDQDEA